jgi:uncharacterized protein (TIGR02646 family)
MIQVKKNFTAIPNHLAKGGKSYNHQDVKDALTDIYNGKCCYCEQDEEYFEVEHYRPRNAVKGLSTHPGYGWLKLEWSNLLYVCKICNAGTGAKSTKFPIANEDNRIDVDSGNIANNVADSTFLLTEGALLLHPEIENPEEHLTVLPDGKLQAINNSAKGSKTIEVCNLNRDSLYLERRKVTIDNLCKDLVQEFKNGVDAISECSIEEEVHQERILMMCLGRVFSEIKKGTEVTEKFTLLHRVFYEQFDEFIAVNMHIKNAPILDFIGILKGAFLRYKTELKTI